MKAALRPRARALTYHVLHTYELVQRGFPSRFMAPSDDEALIRASAAGYVGTLVRLSSDGPSYVGVLQASLTQ